jgi:hypothetical protein
MLAACIGTTVVFSLLSRLVYSSELLGCFFAGLVFSSSSVLRSTWPVQMKRLLRWGTALFFAATISFGIPRVSILFSRSALGRGAALLAAGACCAGTHWWLYHVA